VACNFASFPFALRRLLLLAVCGAAVLFDEELLCAATGTARHAAPAVPKAYIAFPDVREQQNLRRVQRLQRPSTLSGTSSQRILTFGKRKERVSWNQVAIVQKIGV
jgi:hypothetical protein